MILKPKRITRDVLGFATIGIATGVTSQALGSLGATQAQTAVSHVSSALPLAGRIYGASLVLDAFQSFGKTITKKTRRY